MNHADGRTQVRLYVIHFDEAELNTYFHCSESKQLA
jgi:hypothetical protein